MAIRKRGEKWQVYWRNPYTQKRESCTVSTVQEAQKKDALVKYQLEYEREKFRREEEEKTKTDASPSLSGATIEEIHYLYLKEKQFPRRTLYCQIGALRQAYAAFKDIAAEEITEKQLEQYKADLLRMPFRKGTIRTKLSKLRTILRWAYKRGIIQTLPNFPPLPAPEYEHFVPPSRAELSRMLEASPEHMRRIIVLGTQTGGRVGPSELFRLRWVDVDFERNIIRMPSARKNLHEPWREIPIRASLQPLLATWAENDRPNGEEYVIHYGGKPVTAIGTGWAAMLKRAGITRRIRPYDLRHYFATEMIAGGIDLGTVANLMGHRGTQMLVEHYQHVLTKQKQAAVEALPDVPLCASNCVPEKLLVLEGSKVA